MIGYVIGSLIAIVVGYVICCFVNKDVDAAYIDKVNTLRKQLARQPIVKTWTFDHPVTTNELVDKLREFLIDSANRYYERPHILSFEETMKIAEQILPWQNIEGGWNRLVVVTYIQKGGTRVSWTWEKEYCQVAAVSHAKHIVNKDAISGYEDIIKSMSENPIVVYNEGKEESDDGRTETEKA